MKFSVSSSDLQKALTAASGAVPNKSTLPILECVLFEKDGDTLKLAATDLEISIVQRLPVQFETNGSGATERIAVPAKRLLDTLRALPDLPIVAEDLGDLDDAVIKLRDDNDLVGMRVIQFGFDAPLDPDEPSVHHPNQIGEHAVVYTNTHDNNTLTNW